MRRWSVTMVAAALSVGQGAADPCDCLNWRETYSSGQVLCGEGLELLNLSAPRRNLTLQEAAFSRETLGELYDESCSKIFMQMNNNYCLNVATAAYETSDWSGEQWCYVSADCPDLAGGEEISQKVTYPWVLHWLHYLPDAAKEVVVELASRWHSPAPVHRSLSWKLCKKQRDDRLRDRAPLEVLQLAQELKASPSKLTKLAYLTLAGSTWEEVREAVGGGDIGRMPPALVKAIASKDTIVIDVEAKNQSEEQRIVRGTEVYELQQACSSPTPAGSCTGAWTYRRGKDVGDEL